MTKDEREQIMVDMRRDGMSYRQIANAVGVTHPTVMSVVNEGGKDLPPVVTGLDGKTYPAQQQPKPEPPISLFVPGGAVALDPDAAEAVVKVAG